MATIDQVSTIHGRRAARSRLRVPTIVWPVVAMVVMLPILAFLVVSLLT